jgi:aspartyl-tRNA(Asn)/glutamyl-tRNA(Gln) amidotransferase subunit C
MAILSNDDVFKLAQLSRISLSEEEAAKYATEISAILGYVEQLQSQSLDSYTPTYQVSGLVNVTRKDEPVAYGAGQQDLLKNAPATENGHIKVRRMIQ